jgi:hypothetical protein
MSTNSDRTTKRAHINQITNKASAMNMGASNAQEHTAAPGGLLVTLFRPRYLYHGDLLSSREEYTIRRPCDRRHSFGRDFGDRILQLFWVRLIVPTDLPLVAERKRKAQAQTRSDNTTIALIWAVIILGMLVLMLLLADQGFSSPATDWECLF